jgi:L-threonylcarbamoyladenylate synthase
VLPKRAIIPDLVTAGLPSVAVRVSAHPVALALTRAAGVPIAAPSANRFTELSATSATHVARSLRDRVTLLLDGGPTTVGIESTVVDLTGRAPVLLRPGGISAHEIERIVGPLATPPPPSSADAPRPAPGMVERHYAPRATLYLAPAGQLEAAYRRISESVGDDSLIGVVSLDAPPFATAGTVTRVMPGDPAAYARALYATLHELDDQRCKAILVERVPDSVDWDAVRDRLRRAATSLPP